jgi:hypothetical protein
MKKCSILFFVTAIVFTAFMATVVSCNKNDHAKAIKSKERSITIVNKTGNPLAAYEVSTPGGIIIERKEEQADNIVVKIDKAYKDESTFIIQVMDIYKKIYVGDFAIESKGNTQVSLSKEYQKSQGALKDFGNNLSEWFNKTK